MPIDVSLRAASQSHACAGRKFRTVSVNTDDGRRDVARVDPHGQRDVAVLVGREAPGGPISTRFNVAHGLRSTCWMVRGSSERRILVKSLLTNSLTAF